MGRSAVAWRRCVFCRGSGQQHVICPACGGSRRRSHMKPAQVWADGTYVTRMCQEWVDCAGCGGLGRQRVACTWCRGTGRR